MARKKDISLVLTFTDKSSAQVKRTLARIEGQLGKHGVQVKRVERGYQEMEKSTEGARTGMSKMQKVLKSTAMQMAAGMGVMMGIQGAMRLISNTMRDVMQVGREFEVGWASVTTMLSVADGQIIGTTMSVADMREELLAMDSTLGATTDLAKGMYQVLSASVEPSKAIMFLGEAAKSAQAGMTDTATSVDALTTVINAYGLEAEDVTKISDIMFQTVKRGKLTYEGMSAAIGTIAPIAAQVGVKFEEIAAAMATLTRQGIDVNTTTVQLRQVLVSILKPTSEAQAAAKRLGLDFTSAALKAKGLAGFLLDLKEKVGDDNEALTALFGNVRALTGVMGLAGKGAAGFALDLGLMKNATGATAVAFEKMMKTSDFWMKTMSVTMDKLKIAFFEGLTKPMRENITSVKDLNKQLEELQDTVTFLGEAVSTAGKEGLKRVGWLTAALRALVGVWSTLENVAKATAKAIEEGDAWYSNETIQLIIRQALALESLAEKTFTVQDALDKLYKSSGVAGGILDATVKEALGTFTTESDLARESLNKFAAILGVKEFEKSIDIFIAMGGSFKDLAGEILAQSESAEEAAKALKGLKKVFGLLDDPIDEVNKSLEIQDRLAKSLSLTLKKDLIDKLKDLKTALIEYKNELTTVEEEKMKKEILDLRKELGLVEEGYITVTAWLKKMNEEMEAAKKVTGEAGNALKNILGPSLFKVIGHIEILKKFIPEVRHDFEEWTGVLGEFSDKTEETGKVIESIWDEVAVDIGNALADAMQSFTNFSSFIDDIAKSILRTWSTMVGDMVTKMIQGVAIMEAAIQQMAVVFAAYVAVNFVQNLLDQFNIIGDRLDEESQAIIDNLERIQAAGEEVRDVLNKIGLAPPIIPPAISGEDPRSLTNEDPWADAIAGFEVYMRIIELTRAQLEGFNNLWATMIELAKQYGFEGTKAFIDMIIAVREAGIEIKALTDYINDQLGVIKTEAGSAADGLAAMALGAVPGLAELVKTQEDLIKQLDALKGIALEYENVAGTLVGVIREVKIAEKAHAKLVDKFKALGEEITKVTDDLEAAEKAHQALLDELANTAAGTAAYATLETAIKDSGIAIDALKKTQGDLLRQYPKLEQRVKDSSDAMEALKKIQRELNDELKNLSEGSRAYQQLQLQLEITEAEIKALGESSAESMARLERQTLAVFNAMIVNGATYLEAINSIGPTLDTIAAQHEAMGTTGGAAIQALLRIREVVKANESLFNAIQGNLDVLKALGNTAFLTEESFKDTADQAAAYYDQLIDAGFDANQALAAMGPTLAQLEFFATQYGFAIDDTTQAMIDQAREAGVLGAIQKTDGEIMTTGFKDMVRGIDLIVERLGNMIRLMGGVVKETKEIGDEGFGAFENMGSGVDHAAAQIEKAGEDGSDAFYNMEKSAEDTTTQLKIMGFEGMNAFAVIENGATAAAKQVDTVRIAAKAAGRALDNMTTDPNYTPGTAGSNGTGPSVNAARGFEGTVTGPYQFNVEPGVIEHVSMTPVGPSVGDRGSRSAAGGGGMERVATLLGQLITATKEGGNVSLEPIVIPTGKDYVIEFVTKQLERGEIEIPIDAVGRT